MQVRQLRNVLSRTANTKALSAGLGRRRASRRVGGRPRSSVVALVPRAAPAAPCAARPLPHATVGALAGRSDVKFDGAVSRARGDRPSARPGPPVRRRRGGDSGALLSQSVTVSQLFHGPTPRSPPHPSTAHRLSVRLRAFSAAPVQPQVPSTNRVLAPPGARGLLNDCGASRRGREVIVLSPSEQGVPCRFLPCTAGAGLC